MDEEAVCPVFVAVNFEDDDHDRKRKVSFTSDDPLPAFGIIPRDKRMTTSGFFLACFIHPWF